MNRFFTFFVGLFIMMSSVSSCVNRHSIISNELERRDTTLLDLFYGMERHYSDEESCGCVLDSLRGVLKQVLASKWLVEGQDGEDSYQYDCSFCVYTDSVFPSPEVASKVSYLLESMYVRDFISYHTGESRRQTPSDMVLVGHDILRNARREFQALDSSMRISEWHDTLQSIPAFRTSFVACRIYGNDTFTTYLLESSIDYNGSNGCPSCADYYTLDNRTGEILQYCDMVEEGKDSLVTRLQYEEYCKEYRKKYDPDSEPILDEDAFKIVPDVKCAIVKEGILFYYHPYEIAIGAEGQYNLIVKI